MHPQTCALCGGLRASAPNTWATCNDFWGANDETPEPGGLGPCGDLHEFVQFLDAAIKDLNERDWEPA